MMIWILKKFCRDGEIILDPMAGIFTTGIEGMRLFPNSLFIGVELEDKFVKMARANIKKVEKIAKKDMFLKIGKAICVQGDARELSRILEEKVNKIITSPPFADSKHNYKHGLKVLGKNFSGRRAWETRGQVNKIISSPPFGQAQSGGGIAKKGYDGPKHTPTDLVGKRSYMPENVGGKENIGNLPYGQADKIVTSPPYSGTEAHHDLKFMKESAEDFSERVKRGKIKGHGFTSEARKRVFEKAEKGKSENPENIGNLQYGQADKIVTSPPFGGKVQHKTNYLGKQKRESGFEYSDNLENIGNMPHGKIDKIKSNVGSLTGKTYLGEMLKVYQECFKILKARGLMILIVKDFIRNKKRIRLGEDTIKLSEAAGFIFKEIYYRKIEHLSFWRVLYSQKFPEVEKIDSEEILIFEKTPSGSAG